MGLNIIHDFGDHRFKSRFPSFTIQLWEFQDPKMEVPCHIRPYFVGIFPYIGLKHRPYIWQVPPIQDPEIPIDIMGDVWDIQWDISWDILRYIWDSNQGETFRIQMEVRKRVNVPYVWSYELWGYSHKHRPKKQGIGTCHWDSNGICYSDFLN